MIRLNHRYFPYLILFVVTFLLDRLTKYLILKDPGPHEITDFLTLSLQFNRGISWGILNSESNAVFVGVSVLILLFTLGFLVYTIARWLNYYVIYPEVLILSGGFSNFIDRILYGGVVDYILISWQGWSWPIFNIADVCIVFGITWMLIKGYFEK